MGDTINTSEECYAKLVQTFLSQPNVTQEGQGFGSSALKVRGKIFAMLVRGRLVVKLSQHRVDALIASEVGERYDPRRDGRLMKEWLSLASISEEDWLSYAREALEFVASK